MTLSKVTLFHMLYPSQHLTWSALRGLPHLHGRYLPCPVEWKLLEGGDLALIFPHSQPLEQGLAE